MSDRNVYADMVLSHHSLRKRSSDAVARGAPTIRVPLLVCAAIAVLAGMDGVTTLSASAMPEPTWLWVKPTGASPIRCSRSNTFGYSAGGWRVDRHPRLLGDVNGGGGADIVGFGNAGTYVALGQTNGLFANPAGTAVMPRTAKRPWHSRC
jgi:hypothetical protein